MSTFKKCSVVMLPTNKKASEDKLILREDRLMFQLKKEAKNDRKWHISGHFHLYILSDDEIKEGDWILETLNKVIFQVKGKGNDYKNSTFKKIIATTDKSLGYEESIYDPRSKTGGKWIELSQPSQSFIEVFVREYNKGNIITYVMVEYEEIHRDTDDIIGMDGEPNGLPYYECNLKVNPKDNTITIKKVKDNFNLKELEDALVRHYLDIGSTKGCNLGEDVRVWTKKWIEENL